MIFGKKSASDMDRKSTVLQIFQKRKNWKRKFTVTRKSLKFVHINRHKRDKTSEDSMGKSIYIKYTHLYHVCLSM